MAIAQTNQQVLEAAFESAEKRKRFFFEPGSRLQLVDKLQHLIRFSDFLLLITGPEGAGKTTLLDQLGKAEADTTLRNCRIQASIHGSLDAVLKELALQLVPDIEPDAGNDLLLNEIYQTASMMAQEHIQWVVMVDDAEQLSEDALKLLLQLLSDAEGAAVKPHLMLLGLPALQDRLHQSYDFDLLEGQTHHQQLLPFSEAESRSYLQQRYSAISSLSEKQLSLVCESGEGYPGRLNNAVESLFRSGSLSKPSARSGLPKLHLISVVVVLLGVLAASLWQYWPAGSDDQSRTLVQLDVPVAADEVKAADVSVPAPEIRVNKPASFTHQAASEESVSVPEITAIGLGDAATKVVEIAQVAVKEQAPDSTKVIASSSIDIGNTSNVVRSEVSSDLVTTTPAVDPEVAPRKPASVEPSASKAMVAAEPAKVVVATATTATQTGDAKELLSWPQTSYSLQVLGAAVEKSARDFIARQQQPQKFYMFASTYKGKPWYVVVYGQYKNRQAAVSASKNLPQELRKLRPWARSVQGIQADLSAIK